jgi:hypothetical protein
MHDTALARFATDLNRFATLSSYVDKARAVADRFSPQVVAKVINGHQASLEQLALELMPMVIDLENVEERHRAALADLDGIAKEARRLLEELELRKLIGDLDDDAYAAEAAPHEQALAAAQDARAPHDDAIAEVHAQLERWSALGHHTGMLQAEQSNGVY